MIRADGEGGFEARAFASVPTLLRRAASIARAAAPSVSVLDDEVTADGGGAATPASVASTGRKRKRARRGGGDSRGDGETRTSGEADAGRRERPGLDSEDDATESAETTELALKSVAVMDVNPSLAHALGAARGDGNGDDDGDEDGEKDAMGAATAANEGASRGTPPRRRKRRGALIPTTRVEPARCSSGRERHPPFTRVLDALVRRREAEEARVAACPFGPPSSQPVADDIPDRPFLTDALLRAARDVAADATWFAPPCATRARKRRAPSATPRTRNARRGRTRTSPRARTRRDCARRVAEPKQERRVALARNTRRGPAHGLGRRRARASGARAARTARTTRETTHDDGAETRAGEETHREHHTTPPPPDEAAGEAEEESGGSRAQVERTWVRRARAVRRRAGWGARRGEAAWNRASRRLGGGGGWGRGRATREGVHTPPHRARAHPGDEHEPREALLRVRRGAVRGGMLAKRVEDSSPTP